MPSKLKTLIAQNKTRKVLDLLLAQSKSLEEKELYNELTALSGRYESMRREERQGLLSTDEAAREKAKINNALLAIIDEFPSHQNDKVSTSSSNRGWFLYIPLILLVGLLIWWLSWPVKNTEAFSVTFNVHGPKGRMDMILENQGTLFLDLNGDRREAPIGNNGQVVFQSIPFQFKGKAQDVGLDAKGYQTVEPNKQFILNDEPIYLAVKSSCLKCRIEGNVRRQSQFVEGLTVRINEWSDTTNANGHFLIKIPPEREQNEYTLIVQEGAEILWEDFVTPSPGSMVEILLQ